MYGDRGGTVLRVPSIVWVDARARELEKLRSRVDFLEELTKGDVKLISSLQKENNHQEL